jgi:hypothetical protein
MLKRLLPPTVLLALYLVVATSAGAASTREEYALQADPICHSADVDTARLFKQFLRLNKQSKLHAAANALEGVGRRNFSADAALRLIPPPPGDEAALSGWIDLWDQIGQKWVLAASAYRLGRYGRVSHLIRSTNPLGNQADALISGFPFRSCGGP